MKEEALEGSTLRIISAAELSAQAEADWTEWLKTRRIGCAQYVPANNTILLCINDNSTSYEVDLDRCRTAKALTDWLFHLAGKTWCQGSVLTDFIQCLERAIEEREGQQAVTFFKAANCA